MQISDCSDLFDLSHTIAAEIFDGVGRPWEVLPRIKDFILTLGAKLDENVFTSPAHGVWIAKKATVTPTAVVTPPCIIDEGAEIRHCAFIRGCVIIGKGAVIGNSCEIKNSIVFDKAEIPHFNYCGDSIIGYHGHLSGGVITSNVKSDRTNVTVRCEGERIETGLRKFGAMVGDYAEIGCGTVLNPGTVIGRRTTVYPLSSVRGVVEADSIYKDAENIIKKQ